MRRVCVAAASLAACSGAWAQDSIAYAYDYRGDDNFFSFVADNPDEQELIQLFPEWAPYALDFNADGSVLYAINHNTDDDDGDGDPDTLEVGTVDLESGDFTLNGVLEMPTPIETGLSCDPTDGTFYLCTGSDLYTIDPETGETAFIGTFSGTDPNGDPIGLVIDIAIDNDGNMYAHDIGRDALWQIEKATAVGTFVGFSGLDANFAQGMDFDPATNQLYAAIYTGGGTGSYAIWDTEDGTLTEIVDMLDFPDPFADGREMEMTILGGEAGCYPDCNGDQSLDILDFVCFQGEFQNGADYADCNGDGELDILDFVCFQGEFQGGCP